MLTKLGIFLSVFLALSGGNPLGNASLLYRMKCTTSLRDPNNKCSDQIRKDMCAYFKGEDCESGECPMFAVNQCTACHDQSVKFYSNQTCQGDKIFCHAKSRPHPFNCNSDEYEPVCAYYTENCPLEICGMDAINSCYGCSQPQVIYYKPGKCDTDIQIFSCEYTFCNSEQSSQVYQPVCGILRDCIGDNCTRTFWNKCLACSSGEYTLYKMGVCETDRKECDQVIGPGNCTGIATKPVCAFFLNSFGELVSTTTKNSCNACSDPAVKYYTSGKCTQQLNDRVYCLPNNRPQNCSNKYAPVCGFFELPIVDELSLQFNNECSACQDPRIVYYEPGPCKIYCDDESGNINDKLSLNPVCGSYTLNQETYQVSIQNSFVACDHFVPTLDSYKIGLCPGDVGIRCENSAICFTYGDIMPVCGLFREECQDSSCRKTFAEPIIACEYSSVTLYKPGVCPGDEGVSCDPYRPKAGEELCIFSDLIYQEVCGYFVKGCEDNSCRMNFNNQCEACAISTVLFFKKGPCYKSQQATEK